ncbi:hypothetical protein PT974_00339 [Cladobotryum mycophilum]|uniref:Bromo domain-containing protein n=1 Tax=Cladobotryum mycophilum TaxID=491253 RepID=A0ABR0T1T6_9HYPO
MNHPAAYTPLESLFLFQSLLTHGVDAGAFARISELLKNNALIKSGGTYDPTRLSPDALQQLFLLLLRDELRSEAERAAEGKRKLGTPPLPTLKDVYENVEKVPILVDRLYGRYRDHMVTLIREDERKFSNVQKEIQLLEKSEKERLARAASQNGTPVLAPRDPKAAAASHGPHSLPGQVPVTPAAIRRGPTPNTPVLPPKTPTPTIATPKVAPPAHLLPGAQPQRPVVSPKPPNGTASVLQAPAGPHTQPGHRVLQPPAQPPKQVISPRPEVAVLHPKEIAAAPPAPSPAAGTLKWEKPYQPPPTTQVPQAGQFAPTLPPNMPVQQKVQLQQQYQQHQQWQQQQQQQQQHSQPPHHPPQQQPQYSPHPHGQVVHPQMQQQQQQPPQARPTPTKPVLVPPQSAGQLVPPLQPGPPRPVGSTVAPQARPPSAAGAVTPGRPIQPQQPLHAQQSPRLQPAQHGHHTPQATHSQQTHAQQVPKPPLSQLAQKFQQQKPPTPRPLAAATPVKAASGHVATSAQIAKATPAPQRWQTMPPQQGQHGSPSASPAPLASSKSYASPYMGQQPRPAIPEHMIRQAATPGPVRRLSTASPAPRTPGPSTPALLKRGFGTKWASHSTPSTPGPLMSEPESPAYEPVSPPQRPTVLKGSTTKPIPTLQIAKATPKADVTVTPTPKAGRGRPPRNIQRGRGTSATPSATGTRRSQSVASQTDELSLDHSVPAPKVKKEVATPRLREETGDTTADESVHGRGHLVTPSSISRVSKRKRQDPSDLSGPPTHVLWTRGFTKVSSSALDQISSHRDANMFATALREKDAPNYRQIVLQPQDITSIRSAIKQGNKAAQQAANNLPGGDPGTAAVWLPISDDLVPPKGIINSAHLERELVHMFCNAIMYNPDPDRGPGPAFMQRSQDDEEEVVGYRLDENGVVKNTQSMFIEGSVVTPADDTAEDEDELAADGDSASVTGTVKRRRISTRG